MINTVKIGVVLTLVLCIGTFYTGGIYAETSSTASVANAALVDYSSTFNKKNWYWQFKFGAKGGGQLQANPGNWENIRLTPGVGMTIENNFIKLMKGKMDLGLMIDIYYTQKGTKWVHEGVEGFINADYITIPIFIKFRPVHIDIGLGWLIPGVIAGFENNIFLSTEYLHADSGFKYKFYDEEKINKDPLHPGDAEVNPFSGFTPGFQAGGTLSWLFDYGEITLEIKYAMDLTKSDQAMVIPLDLDERIVNKYPDASNDNRQRIDLPSFQSQGIQFYLSYSVPLYLFKKVKIYQLKGKKGKKKV